MESFLPSTSKSGFFRILNAYFRHDGHFPYAFPVDIARHMAHALVPDVAAAIFPSMLYQNGMDGRPPDFSIPEPESGLRCGFFGPSPYVRFIPSRQFFVRRRVSRITGDSVRAVGYYNDGSSDIIALLDIAMSDFNVFA